jgi:DHA1 family solute carrier family 18 vesicular amine transporter 1/2
VNSIGFEWMLFGIAILNFLYAPLMYLLRNPPTKEEKKVRQSRHSHVMTLTLTG